MKIINSRKELLDYTEYDCIPYDVDAHWVIHEVEYDYPILLECVGTTHLGTGYKAYTQEDIETVEKFKQIVPKEEKWALTLLKLWKSEQNANCKSKYYVMYTVNPILYT